MFILLANKVSDTFALRYALLIDRRRAAAVDRRGQADPAGLRHDGTRQRHRALCGDYAYSHLVAITILHRSWKSVGSNCLTAISKQTSCGKAAHASFPTTQFDRDRTGLISRLMGVGVETRICQQVGAAVVHWHEDLPRLNACRDHGAAGQLTAL